MPLASGDRLGPYEVTDLLGRGGMGEVYRARDPRLRRDVAIKVPAQQFSERFQREARAVAALSHPNICTVYDVGPNYLVMELVEGPTLAERIKEGVLTLDEALPIARQIAAGLEAAHEKGITHRDLKPGNIKIKADGLVKLLDFGLAKIETPSVTLGEDSPTLSMESVAATEAGTVVGTAAYMSPEQARGKASVDKRTDIWAFGVVLHEMLTGRKLFRRDDVTETLAAILKDPPDLSQSPFQVRRLIAKCLEKDPARRLRDMGDAWDLLDETVTTTAPAPAVRQHSRLFAAAALTLAAVAIVFAMLWLRTPANEFRSVQFALAEPEGSRFTNEYGAMSLSPDGRYLIFGAVLPESGLPGLWLRALDSLESRPLAGTDRSNYSTWSPDSKSIAFFSVGEKKIKRLDIAGGSPVTLADAGTESPVTKSGTWNSDGIILIGGRDGLLRVPASGGDATLITKANPEMQETGHGFPQFLPDGKRFLYFVASLDQNVQGVYASSLDQPGQRTLILRTSSKAVYAPPRGDSSGYLLWMQGQTLVAQGFDADALTLAGKTVSVAPGVGTNLSEPIRAGFWADGGAVVYRPDIGIPRRVLWRGADGKDLGEVMPADSVDAIQLSPDGKMLAVSRKVGVANPDIWLWDFARGGVYTRLTFDAWLDSVPVWSPDGRYIAYVSFRQDGGQIYVKEVSGAGDEKRLTDAPRLKVPLDWSRDGKYLLYVERGPPTGMDIWAMPMEGDRKPIPVVRQMATDYPGQLSPDGEWIAYASDVSGRTEVYVRPTPWSSPNGTSTGQWQISKDGGTDPKWRGDGKEIYFHVAPGKILAAAVRAVGKRFESDTPRELVAPGHDAGGVHRYDVTAGGDKFAVVMPGEGGRSVPLVVITNWQANLPK